MQMNNESGSYIEKSYITPKQIATAGLMIGSIFFAYSGIGAIDSLPDEQKIYDRHLSESIGSNLQNQAYHLPTSTWSSIGNVSDLAIHQTVDSKINATESLNVLRSLAFLAVNEDVDNEIERYFASKPIKTKTILINSRITHG